MLLRPLLLGAALTLCAAPAFAETVRHAQDKTNLGETVVPATPKRIVVFDLGALDTLQALGVEGVVGVPSSAMPPALARFEEAAYTHAGTLFEPDYEAVKALKPDLIIIGGRSAKKFAELSAIAPTLDLSTSNDDYIGSAIANAKTLGKLFGKEARAEELGAKLQASVTMLKAKTATGGTGLTLFTVRDKMIAHAAGARFGQIHKEFGVPQATTEGFGDEKTRPLTAQEIAAINPDRIFVLDRGAATGGEGVAQGLLADPLIQGTKAAKANRIVQLDPVEWYIVGGGIRSLQDKADQLLKAYGA